MKRYSTISGKTGKTIKQKQTGQLRNHLVSIVMAVKDTEPYLHACLDSILAQTYPHWELVAVNDHSTDRSPEILRQYAAQDARIRVFDSDRPSLIPALQVAYRHCRGTLINRMDSDDRMPHDKLAVLVEAWQQHGPGTVIAGGTEHFVDEGEVGDGFRRYERWINDVARRSAHYEEIYQECVIPSHSWLMHRDDLDTVGAFDPEVYPEDYDLCFRIYQQKLRVVGIDKVLHYWRDRADRISRTWECYRDNRYFDLKLRYFYAIDREPERPLVLWGAGRNGKDMAQLLLARDDQPHWVCDNPRKIGKDVYGVRLAHYETIPSLTNPQIMVVTASPAAKVEICHQLRMWGKQAVKDYWFFA